MLRQLLHNAMELGIENLHQVILCRKLSRAHPKVAILPVRNEEIQGKINNKKIDSS